MGFRDDCIIQFRRGLSPGALFHIRIALDREKEQRRLTDPTLAQAVLDSARLYETKQRWHVTTGSGFTRVKTE